MNRWRLAIIVAVAVASTACSPDAAGRSEMAASMPPDATAPISETPSAGPREAVVAAYEAYTAATVEALAAGDADLPALDETAADGALKHARRRVRANTSDGVVPTGTLEPSVTGEEVVFDNAGTHATVTDCVLNGLELVSVGDPDEVVAEATGWRQPVVATVEQRDAGWVVTAIDTPIEDGSGEVPSPPTDPPFLRGPAQSKAPPSCVPPDMAAAAVDAYLAFHEAFDTAAGLGDGTVVTQSPELNATAIDPQLGNVHDYLADLKSKGHAARGEPDSRDPWAIATREFDESVVIYDCVTLGESTIVEADTGDVVVRNDAGLIRLDGAELRRVDGGWKVASWEIIERGLRECTSSASS